MITMIEKSIMVTNTGYCHVPIRRSLDAGKERQEVRKAEIQRDLEDTTKVQSVPQVSDSKRENREYDKCGKYLSIAQKNKEDYKRRRFDIKA